MRSAGTSNSQCASITSSPLFISVAESMVIFGPIFQVGCRKRIRRRDAREGLGTAGSRNGPPDAVRISRRDLRPSRPCRHWWMALCSLSTGSTATPCRRAASITSAPAITRTSLFASAIVLPASIAASTASSAAVPDEAHSTMSTSGCVATAIEPLARRRRDDGPGSDCAPQRGPDVVQRLRAVAIAIAAGAERRDLLGEARDVLAGRERDDPQPIGMRVDDRQRALPDRAGRAEDRDALHQTLQVARRTRRTPAPANSQLSMRSRTPPWPGNQRRRVLDAGAALQQRLEQVADDAERAMPRRPAPAAEHAAPPGNTQAPPNDHRRASPNTHAADRAFDGLLRADRRRQRLAAERAAGVVLAESLTTMHQRSAAARPRRPAIGADAASAPSGRPM